MQRLIDACGDFAHDPSVDAVIATGFATPTNNAKPLPNGLPYPEEWTPPMVSPALARFKISWENFVDTLMREWKTFNLVSALLCTTILTIFQIPEAAGDPLTRWSALLSLVCALISLSFGCVYIVHFGTMRSMDRASRWAEEARKTRAALLWNIWVLLATPAVWLAWSMIAFCVAILSFVWRTGSAADPQGGYAPLSRTQALGVRVAISAVFVFGLVNFWMIITTFSSYSHISVRRDRRSRFGRGAGAAVAAAGGEERERGRAQKHKPKTQPDEEKEREKEKDRNRVSDSMVGLGLTGLGQGSPASAAGVILENVDLEKGEAMYLSGERMGALGKMSPRVSPKL
ncbi:hypothetical protein DICSQDRAFT_108072 [Dichomitus squalens LYAD-421 SS1]|uniref:Uncharacterized protein n=1 Tax=Dichomitus squalens (strain LYAD-421) TaxID=732165 RepID=R7SVS9_DICSQ|nr:uncharacterized protein DICSQDRAFT_108072 [Dichomitus squalens LYAD-421 SS1]EJF60038.1 hypothetical protein DICSQDRAFT_108072 [Dichomitus squalens LYAD-421 SS1]